MSRFTGTNWEFFLALSAGPRGEVAGRVRYQAVLRGDGVGAADTSPATLTSAVPSSVCRRWTRGGLAGLARSWEAEARGAFARSSGAA